MESVIQEKAAAAVERVFAEPRQPTDQWGNPKGEPVTMAEQVQKLVDEALSKVSGGDSFSREPKGTIVQQTVAKLVKETVQKEVKAAVDAERDAIVAKVAASSAAVLTEGLKRAVKA